MRLPLAPLVAPFALSLLALSALQPASAQIASSYTITNLGTLGGSTSFALALNNVGQITGNSQTPVGQASPRLNGFLWQNGTMQNIGVLPGSNNFSRGYSINDSGQVVGESDNNSSKAFLYSNGTLTALGGLTGASGSGVARGINNDGVIVGVSSNGTASRAFVRDTSGVMRDLGSLDGQVNTGARALAISNTGYIPGYSGTASGVSHAFLYRDANNNGLTDAGEMIDLDAGSSFFSEAVAVNNLGILVGDATVGTTPGGTSISNPFLWTVGSNGTATRTAMGTLGLTFGNALGVNDASVAVGSLTNISGLAQKAFVWSAPAGMLDLNTLLTNGSGWTLTTATAINNKGEIIGYGSFGGNTTAFRLTPNATAAAPEPGSLFLLGASGLGCILYRRKK